MSELFDQLRQGSPRALGRYLRRVDDRDPEALRVLSSEKLEGHSARLIGLTGIPGAGKSTLTAGLVAAYRAQGHRVAVVAVDPSSPFSGGAILGDRIRMQEFTGDPNVFIRSVATRGNLGGLTRSTRDVVKVFIAAGFDTILIETVGVGQDEVDIVHLAETNVVITVPGTGDGVQSIKAGLLEIADVFVVNKADLDGAGLAARHLKSLLDLEGGTRSDWRVPILNTVATRRDGVSAVVDAIAAHGEHLAESGEGRQRHCLRVEAELRQSVREALEAQIMKRSGGTDAFRRWSEAVVDGQTTIASVVSRFLDN